MLVFIGIVIDQKGAAAKLCREVANWIGEVEVEIRNVDGEDAARFEMFKIEIKGLASE